MLQNFSANRSHSSCTVCHHFALSSIDGNLHLREVRGMKIDGEGWERGKERNQKREWFQPPPTHRQFWSHTKMLCLPFAFPPSSSLPTRFRSFRLCPQGLPYACLIYRQNLKSSAMTHRNAPLHAPRAENQKQSVIARLLQQNI